MAEDDADNDKAEAVQDQDAGSDPDEDSVTEEETEGWGERIGNSFVGAVIGIVMVIASFVLLYWNEGRAVAAISALDRAARQVIEVAADPFDRGADGKLVHLSGMMETSDPARDSTFGVGGQRALRLSRKVEMFQWKEEEASKTEKSLGGSETKKTTYTYRKEWRGEAVDSSKFHQPQGHRNPAMTVSSTTFDSNEVRLGAYRVDRALLDHVSAFRPLPPGDAPEGYQKIDQVLYRSKDPSNPAIGDIRVTFEEVPAQTMSVLAGSSSGALVPFRGAGGYEIALASPGAVAAAEMLREKKHEESILTWVLRGVGFVVMLIGFVLMGAPLAALAAVLPFLEGVVDVGVGMVAVMLAVPLTLITIALAWLAHRPLIGGGLIIVGIGAAVAIRLLHRRHPPPVPAAG